MGSIEIMHERASLDNIMYQVGACIKVLQTPYDILKKFLSGAHLGSYRVPFTRIEANPFSHGLYIDPA
jgi:hypothetical protein